jgi:hypothetical protein
LDVKWRQAPASAGTLGVLAPFLHLFRRALAGGWRRS